MVERRRAARARLAAGSSPDGERLQWIVDEAVEQIAGDLEATEG